MKKFLPKRKVIEIKQPIGSFYLGKFSAKELHRVANKSLSRYKDTEKGIQRDVDPARIKAIREYVHGEFATFPNSIIIAVDYDDELAQNWEYDPDESTLLICDNENAVNVIDGQHRLFGLDVNNEKFELPVSIFLGLPLVEQGIIFATINNNQRQVNQSLVYDLYGLSKERRIETVAFQLVSLLNEEIDSPWYTKIKMLGKAKNDGDLSQGAFSKYIHERLLKKGRVLHGLYEEKKDAVIYKLLLNYFSAIQEIFPDYWRNEDKKYVLTKTTGFVGFMSFFVDLVKISSDSKQSLTKEYFKSKIEPSVRKFSSFRGVDNDYPSGAIGQNKIRDILRSSLSDEEKAIAGIRTN